MGTTLVQCPRELDTTELGKSIFLAGGISNCPDWQEEFITSWVYGGNPLDRSILVNPRRENFDINDPKMTKIQIEWEYRHLLLTDLKVFWFPKETVCPITLFELAYCAQRGDDIVVGTHKEYCRKEDVIEQLKHLRPDIKIVHGIYDLKDAAGLFLVKKYGKDAN